MNKDCIELKVPAKPEYVVVTRLTTSAVASRLEFDVDDIEDIKVAVAEAVIILINQAEKSGELIVSFFAAENELTIKVESQNVPEVEKMQCDSNEQSELSFYIIQSMIDKVEMHTENGILQSITMTKKCGS